jgi:hypothetical protein
VETNKLQDVWRLVMLRLLKQNPIKNKAITSVHQHRYGRGATQPDNRHIKVCQTSFENISLNKYPTGQILTTILSPSRRKITKNAIDSTKLHHLFTKLMYMLI